MAKKLTKTELLEMEKNLAEQQLQEKQVEIFSIKKNNELLNMKIKQLETQLNIKELDSQIGSFKNELSIKKKISRDFNNKMKTKYKVKKGFGINPDTGEIIEDD